MYNKRSLIAIVSFIFLSALSSCGSGLSEEQVREAAKMLLTEEHQTQQAELPPTDTPLPTNTPRPTNTIAPTETIGPTATSSLFGSRENPVPLRTTIELNYQQYSWESTYLIEVSIDEVIRGEAAWQAVQEANMFNDEPSEGFEYINIYVAVHYVSSPDNSVFDMYGGNFELVSVGQILDNPSVVEPDPQFSMEGYPDATVSGWITKQVKTTDPNPLLILGRSSDNPGVFFSLTE